MKNAGVAPDKLAEDVRVEDFDSTLADQDIATSDSAVRVLVIRAQEDWAIARECWRLARHGAGGKPTE